MGWYLYFYVLETKRADKREAAKEDVGLRIRQRPKTVVAFLAIRIPNSEKNYLSTNHHFGRIVTKDWAKYLWATPTLAGGLGAYLSECTHPTMMY